MQFGMGLDCSGDNATSGGSSLTAPVLTLDSPLTNPPTFSAVIDLPLVGDVIRLQLSTDSAFGSTVVDTTNTLDAAEVADMLAAFVIGVLGAGTYYARARQERSSDNSAWSNSASFTIVSTARQWASLDAYVSSAGTRQFATLDAYIVETT